MLLQEAAAAIGHGVVYEPHHGAREDGTIVRTNERYVFVLYRGDAMAKATLPEQLRLLAEEL